MSVSQTILFTLMVLTAIMTFLTYTPLDKTNFWIYWVRTPRTVHNTLSSL
jgi:hypothetical protein